MRHDTTARPGWRICVATVGALFAVCASATASLAESSTWSRNIRPGGETWVYRFTVPERAPQPNIVAAAGPRSSSGGEALRVGVPAVIGRTPDATSTVGGAAATTVDLQAQRAYLNTRAGGQGDEVTAPTVGQTVYFHLDLRVVGTSGSLDVSRRAVLDGQTFCNFTASTMAGDYFSWCSDGWVATAGSHTLRWDLDVDNTIAESDETNNSVSASWTSAQTGQVDLAAERAYLKTAAGGQGNELTTPVVGQTVFFYLDFSIVGSSSAITADRRAVLDGQTFCSFTGTSPPGNYYAWCNDGWTVTAGAHTLEWDLDFHNAVTESNETNNAVSTMWTAAPPGSVDLEAQRAYLKTMSAGAGDEVATPGVGQTVYFYLDFRVVGSGATVAADRQATVDGQPYCGFTGASPPGDYFAWCNDGWTATAGSHTLQWTLDANNTVAETNENNNSASTTWMSGADSCAGDCNGDGDVSVSELVTMVNIALGNASVSACSAGDANGDGEIAVNEIVAGVNRALSGCG